MLLLFGKEGDWEILEKECAVDPQHTLLLWPALDALTVKEWIKTLPSESPWAANVASRTNTNTNTETSNSSSSIISASSSSNSLPTLRVLVLDGVYSQARTMFRTLQKRLSISVPVPPHIALHPSTLSVYHRAQNGYAQTSATTVKKSSDPDALHICTVEAVALLMNELGRERERKCCDEGEGELMSELALTLASATKRLVRAVEVNNLALVHDVGVRPPK